MVTFLAIGHHYHVSVSIFVTEAHVSEQLV